jgi:hypothetical protein
MKPLYLIIIGISLMVAGFFIGRATTTTGIVTKYVKGETITTSVNVPGPEKIITKFLNPLLPIKHDTIIINKIKYQIEKVDTAKIIANYIQRKYYIIPLFDNNNGKLTVTPVIQYNALDSLGFTFTPIEKITTITKEKIFTPFITASYNSFNYVGVGGGIYYHNIGLGAKYMTNFTNKGFEVNANIKF